MKNSMKQLYPFLCAIWILLSGLKAGTQSSGKADNSIRNNSAGNKIEKSVKQIDAGQFVNPPVGYRPLRIIHSNLDTVLIAKLKQLGYGGMVTNVSFENYLRSEKNWKKLQENISFAIEQGLRIWLYDEKGYPSGTAGGLVLAEHPELEAQGLAVIDRDAKAPENVIIDHPEGHGRVVLTRAYRKQGAEPDFTDYIDLGGYLDEKGNLRWNAPLGNWKVYYFVQKPFYEGTHAAYNWTEKRRYINLFEKQAAETYIRLTHHEYFKYLGQYFGKGIEAFFTDEPALPGTYFTGYNPPKPPPVLDVPDPDFHLFPTLNWGNSFLMDFKNRRGYDLLPFLPYLVAGKNEKAQMVRRDYYHTVAELVAENFFEPIENFCNETGVASSGHLLLEENLYIHPVFEGDILSMYKHMQYPGIDLLTAFPQNAKNWGVTVAKFASSVAGFYNKKHVMSEISNAFDYDHRSLIKQEAGINGRMASVGVQFAYGVDHFNSYYVHNQMTDTENRQLTDYIARVGYLLGQGKRVPKVALFYPIESIWENTFPSLTLNPQGFNPDAVKMSDNLKEIALKLVENQVDFDYMGTEQLLQTTISGHTMVTPSGGEFTVLILPICTKPDPELSGKIEQLVKAGVHVILQIDHATYDQPRNQLKMMVNHWYNSRKIRIAHNSGEIIAGVKRMITTDLSLGSSDSEIVTLYKCSPSADIYLFVNTGDNSKLFTTYLNSSGKNIRVWNPLTGEVKPATTKRRRGFIQTELKLDKWQTLLITSEP